MPCGVNPPGNCEDLTLPPPPNLQNQDLHRGISICYKPPFLSTAIPLSQPWPRTLFSGISLLSGISPKYSFPSPLPELVN